MLPYARCPQDIAKELLPDIPPMKMLPAYCGLETPLIALREALSFPVSVYR